MKEVTYNGIGGVYCDVCIADDQLYLSGLISEDWTTGELKKGTIEEETEQVMQNLKTMLERYGSGMDKLIRVEIFLTDFYGERDRMNEVYKKHLVEGKIPARLCVGVSGLAAGCKIELMAHAYR